jgi:hypothetical protein
MHLADMPFLHVHDQFGICHTPKQPYGLVPASHDNAVRNIDVDSCVLLWRILVCSVDVSGLCSAMFNCANIVCTTNSLSRNAAG